MGEPTAGRVVRGSASYESERGPTDAPGVSAELEAHLRPGEVAPQ